MWIFVRSVFPGSRRCEVSLKVLMKGETTHNFRQIRNSSKILMLYDLSAPSFSHLPNALDTCTPSYSKCGGTGGGGVRAKSSLPALSPMPSRRLFASVLPTAALTSGSFLIVFCTSHSLSPSLSSRIFFLSPKKGLSSNPVRREISASEDLERRSRRSRS